MKESNPQILLSILIPTTPDRRDCIDALLEVIKSQHLFTHGFIRVTNTHIFGMNSDTVEVVICEDNKEMTIGEKRNLLYRKANGLYSWHVDSDDSITDGAIDKILKALETEPDCVTFQERCIMDGVYKRSNHSLKYDDWQDNFDGFDYVRTPFYKDVIKTEIARAVPLLDLRYGEDHEHSRRLKPHLKSEVHLDEEIYIYQYESSPFNERYGINN